MIKKIQTLANFNEVCALAISPHFNYLIFLGIASCVSETNCQSFSPFSQLWKANKPHIYYVYCRDKVLGSYFAAYSLEEDCTINTMPPKYYKCLPSFLVNDYGFTGASSNGLFLFHSIKLGYVLWNPTMSEYN